MSINSDIPLTERTNRYTLVLDLDETLVHYEEEKNEGRVNFRPFLKEFLEKI